MLSSPWFIRCYSNNWLHRAWLSSQRNMKCPGLYFSGVSHGGDFSSSSWSLYRDFSFYNMKIKQFIFLKLNTFPFFCVYIFTVFLLVWLLERVTERKLQMCFLKGDLKGQQCFLNIFLILRYVLTSVSLQNRHQMAKKWMPFTSMQVKYNIQGKCSHSRPKKSK